MAKAVRKEKFTKSELERLSRFELFLLWAEPYHPRIHRLKLQTSVSLNVTVSRDKNVVIRMGPNPI